MKPVHFVWAALALAVGLWLFSQFGGGPEAKIRARLGDLEELIDKDGAESALAVTDRARRLGGLFTETFVVVAPGGAEFRDVAGLARPYVGYRQGVETLDATVSQVEIEVTGPVARSTMVVSVRADSGSGGLSAVFGDRSGRYRVDAVWRERGRDWRIEEMTIDESDGLF